MSESTHFDAPINLDLGNVNPLAPEGIYTLKVAEVRGKLPTEEGKSPRISIRCDIQDESFAGDWVWEQISFAPQATWRIPMVLEGITKRPWGHEVLAFRNMQECEAYFKHHLEGNIFRALVKHNAFGNKVSLQIDGKSGYPDWVEGGGQFSSLPQSQQMPSQGMEGLSQQQSTPRPAQPSGSLSL